MRLLRLTALFSLFCLFSAQAISQTCSPPQIVVNAKSNNIFSPEQEMILGELTYQRLSGELRFIKDEELLAYLNNIGAKIVKHLPQTGLKFQFFIIDIPEANAFNTPGGYVFVSRKLISFANSEDELAGVLAHELGHATVHHGANDFSEELKRVLNVTQVEDRKDIVAKYNLLIEKRRTKKSSSKRGGHESEQQLEADRIGLFAMVAAGYEPTAFTSFFDRLVETKGKTGNWFTDIFGKVKPNEKRLREMIKATEKIPSECKDNRRVSVSQEFLKWQADVVSFRQASNKEDLPALMWKKELSPKLTSDVFHFAFRNDGKYFLAQDDFAITIIQREPLQVEFQIPAQEAQEAHFTPDGQFVVFGTEGLRYEKWSIAEKRPVEVRELVVRQDCWEHEFSPDGKYLACIDNSANINILETQTGKKIFEKKDFYQLSVFELLNWLLRSATADDSVQRKFFHIEFSPDSHLLAITRSHNFRFVFRFDIAIIDESENTIMALDLTTLKPTKVGGDLKKITKRPFIFLDSNRILGMGSKSIEDSGIFSFPEGKRLAKFPLGGDELKPTSNPDLILVKPLANARLGVVDISRNKIIGGMNKTDIAFWKNIMVQEARNGKIVLMETSYDEEKKMLQNKELGTIDVPVSSIKRLYAAAVSDNFQWLGFSSKSRAGVWNLDSGERKLHVRGLRGMAIGNNGVGIGDFPKQDSDEHSLAVLNPVNNTADVLRQIPEKGARQYGRFVLIRKSSNSPPPESKELPKNSDDKIADANPSKDGKSANNSNKSSAEIILSKDMRFELRDIVNDKLIWSRNFPREAPGFFFDENSGRLILYWTLGSNMGKLKLKEDSALAARAKEMDAGDDDYLIEVIDAFAVKTVGTMFLETGNRSFGIKSGFSEKEWLALYDTQNRVLVYSMKDGSLQHRFFGNNATLNPVRDIILVENYPGELTLYDLATGDNKARVTIKGSAAFALFSLDGKRLFVLSDEQTTYAFDIDKLLANTTTPQTQ